ncbi:KH domain-containing protein 3 [Eschrichtius robustus]|uniref:KH domain-containing protein 3 n=1 Tax=Eschrichtius robustus TaxID=9764 RepID=UPI0035C08EA3
MAAPKRFPTLVQLEQREGTLFEVLGNLTKRPCWFHSEYLKSPRAIHLEAWLVEAIFGLGGEHIPHVECVSQTLLHVNQWDPDGEAEILIFGRPYYQKDVSTMIMNLADYHRQLRAQSSEKPPAREAATQRSPSAARQAATHLCPGEAREAGTQRSPCAVRQAATQRSPCAVRQAATQRSPGAAREAATQRSPGAAREAATQRSPGAAREAATQRSPGAAREAATQRSPGAAREAATQRSPGAAREAATQRSPGAAREAATQRSPGAAREAATQRSPGAAREAATQRSPGAAREAATQSFPEAIQGPRQVRAFGFLAARGRSLSRLGQVLPLCSFTARIWLCKVRDLSGRRVRPHGKHFQA